VARIYRHAVVDYAKIAQDRGWGPGWPVDRTSDMTSFSVATQWIGNTAGDHKTKTPGAQNFVLHKGVSELVHRLLDEVQARGYPLVAGWCWGYGNRPISGTNIPSNHSWGLAIDLNAPDNPYTTPRVTDMPQWLPNLMAMYGFAWGGDYTDQQDSMHYEFMGTPQDAVNALAAYVLYTENQLSLGAWMADNAATVKALVAQVVTEKGLASVADVKAAIGAAREGYAHRITSWVRGPGGLVGLGNHLTANSARVESTHDELRVVHAELDAVKTAVEDLAKVLAAIKAKVGA